MARRLRTALIALLGLFWAAAATAADAPVVFAAASLSGSLDEVAAAFAATGHPKPVISYGGSSALARQIENGAPAALFISADEQWMDYLAQRSKLAADTRRSFLTNRLVLIVPAARPAEIVIRPGFALAGLLAGGHLAMADPAAVPAGRYGQAALANLGVWEDVKRSVAQADNVRAALALVERAEAAAGIVYATDAKATDKVKVAGIFPENTHPPITYPIALLAGQDSAEARAFLAYLLSPDAARLFQAHGFGTR